MVNTTELYLLVRDNDTGDDKWTKVDVAEDMPFPLTYAISDIKDITRRNSSYSKTIRIPGTKDTNILFSHIFDVSLTAAIPIFNQNRKVKCYILRDTLQVFEGSFQLRNIYSKDNRHLTYECIVYGENASFGQAIKEQYVKDLSGLTQLDHYYTYENLIDTWDKDWTHGYHYPLVNYGRFTGKFLMQLNNGKGPKVNDFRPAIYVKWLWNRIFSEAGFTYESEFLNSDVFESLVIPSNKISQANLFWKYYNSFRASLTANEDITATQSIPIGTPVSSIGPKRTYDFSQRIYFDDDTTTPNGDPSNLWSPTASEYTEGIIQPTTPKPQTFYLNLDYTVNNRWTGRAIQALWAADEGVNYYSAGVFNSVNFYRTELRILRSQDLSGATVSGGVAVPIDNAAPSYFSLALPTVGTGADNERNKWVYLLGGCDYLSGNTSTTIEYQPFDGISEENPYVFPVENITSQDPSPYTGHVTWNGQLAVTLNNSDTDRLVLRAGEKLWAEVTYRTDRINNNELLGTSSVPFTINEGSTFFNVPESDVPEGGVISVGSSLDQKLKSIDFVTSIIKMFNLFIETDKDDARNLFIEPRDDYYTYGVNRDWSQKLDLSKETKHDFVSELQNKKIIYTYKKDDDLLNTVYTSRFNEIYGEYDYIVDNDFTTGEKKYEIVFSPTPMASIFDMPSLIVPNIQPVDVTKSDKFSPNIRILYRQKANIDLPSGEFWQLSSELNNQSYTQSSYPYSGNLDHTTDATLDLNFGPIKELYYTNNNLTNNTLFNVYHSKMIQELTDRSSRLVTAYFYLNAQDVARLRFNDSIFVDQLNSGTGVYYRLNRIDYDPTRDGSCRVELLKIINIPAQYFPGVTSSNTTTVPPKVETPIGGVRPLSVGTENRITGLAGGSIGSSNVLEYVNSAFTVGDENYIGPFVESSVAIGNNHKITNYVSNSVLLGGQYNKIMPGVENSVLLGGKNQVLDESDRVKIGGILIGSTNIINGGRDEVLNAFPEGKSLNIINGGRDVVRELGSYDVINIISGGRY